LTTAGSIARLRVRGGDDQAARLAAGVLLADAPDVLGVAQHALGDLEHRPPGSVTAVRRLPPRSKTITPSSSSSSRICLEIPGCEV
jgi:hypothetical protein